MSSIDREIKIFSEFMYDCEHNVKCPRHANTEELFMAMRQLAIEYMHTDKAAIALQRIQSEDSSDLDEFNLRRDADDAADLPWY